MKIIRGLGIFVSVLALVFLVLFNINDVMYRTNNEHVSIFGYKLMTIDNKYDYYLVKESKINDIILYDNVSFRVNGSDLGSDIVKGKINDCLKLANSSTVVCSNNLEGKVVMKAGGARDLLFANKGSIILIIICTILLVLVFLWKPKDKKKELVKPKKEKVEKKTEPVKEEKKDSVVEISTEPFEREVVPSEKTMASTNNNSDQTIVIDTTPFDSDHLQGNQQVNEVQPSVQEVQPVAQDIKPNVELPPKEEIKTDVELPKEETIQNSVSEVDKYTVPNDINGQRIIDIPVETDHFELNQVKETEASPIENEEVITVPLSSYEEEVISVPYDVYTAPVNEEMISIPAEAYNDSSEEDVVSIPYEAYTAPNDGEVISLPVEKYDDSSNEDVISIPYESYNAPSNDELEEVITLPVQHYDDSLNDIIKTPMDIDVEQEEEPITVDYQRYSEMISVPITYSVDKIDDFEDVIKVPVVRYKEEISEEKKASDIIHDANIKQSVEINLDDIKIDSTSEKVKVTPIYSSEQEFNEDVEIL